MGQMVKQAFGSGGKQRVIQAAEQDRVKQEQAVALSRQQQEQAVAGAATEASLGRARRTPRGRRQLIEQDTLG